MDAPLLSVSGLEVTIDNGADPPVLPLQGVDLEIFPGETVGLVGESGSGKSMTLRSVLRILPPGGSVTGGGISWRGRSVPDMGAEELQAFRGAEAAMIYQNPAAALDPVLTVRRQIADAYRANREQPDADPVRFAVSVLRELEFGNPGEVLNRYPHQLSGGMAQRVNIALALACGPALLMADEPTTGLDTTTGLRVLDLLQEQVRVNNAALLFISHDLRAVARVARRIGVMYAGRIVETGTREELLSAPAHPYTRALIECMELRSDEPPRSIPGAVPTMTERHVLCAFRERCPSRIPVCDSEAAPVRSPGGGRTLLCHLGDGDG